ncbi:MAG: DUF4444 domain-containing protein [Leisingera sp.]
MNELRFPPLMQGEPCTEDSFATACRRAVLSCDSGLVCYSLDAPQLEAAIVLAPDVPLRQAMTMLPLCGVSFQNALGALAPPEVAVHLGWDGTLYINGARCGALRAASDTSDLDAVPGWLVIGLALPLWPSEDPGLTPDRTALYAEGCADVQPGDIIEGWARHTLNWITRWEDEGPRVLHAEWRGLAQGLGEETAQGGLSGTFAGVDENFGMLLRNGPDTHLIPLTTLLEQP